MGCVTCTPALGPATGADTAADAARVSLPRADMVQPNTLTGDPLVVHPRPFVSAVYRSLSDNAHEVFLTDAADGQSYTFGELLRRAKCWGQYLRSRGLGEGSIVSISSENNMEGFGVILGTWLVGAAANPINYNFSANDIKVMFESTEPDIIYCNKSLENVEKAADSLEKKTDIVTPGGQLPHIDSRPIMDLEPPHFQPFQVEDTRKHIASILFTSGTTGMPKGIQITDHTLKVFPRSALLGYSPVMVTSPMFWVSNLAGFSYSLYSLKQIVVPKIGWDSRDILQTIQTYKPTSWFTGHSVLLEMVDKPMVQDYDLSSLQSVITGGTLLLANQRREINAKIFQDRLAIRHIYGSTEVGVITRWSDAIDLDTDDYNSVGTLEKGVTLKIMSPEGRQLGPRQEGEIWIKSGSMTPGYLTKKRQVVKAMDENGWYHMGDLGYYDEKKLLYVIGRIKDILKYRGVQIAPAEIEKILDEHEDVLESCVVGRFHVVHGDEPVAFVVLRHSSKASVDDILQYCRENIAEVKWPVDIRIMEALPKSAVGKLLRGELEKMLI